MSHVCDKYCNALQEAKSRIEKLPCPAGLPDWLRVNEASLYRVYFVDWPAKETALALLDKTREQLAHSWEPAVYQDDGNEGMEMHVPVDIDDDLPM